MVSLCKHCHYSQEDEKDGGLKKFKEVEKNEVGERLHFRENSKSTGYIIYTVSWMVYKDHVHDSWF